MTRYRAKPIRFWIANVLIAPLAGALWMLFYYFVILSLFPPAFVAAWMDEPIFGPLLAVTAFFSGYLLGFYVTLLYAILLTLWQWRRKGHGFVEAVLIGWMATALALGGYVLVHGFIPPLTWAAASVAVSLPLVWWVCVWSGITYRVKTDPAPLETAA